MNRQTFFYELRNGLSGLPRSDVEKAVAHYNEVIDDRIEEGLSESEAVATLGSVEQIVPHILVDIPLPHLIKERFTKKRSLRPKEILLLILGFPVWFPLLLIAAALCFLFFLLFWIPVLVLCILILCFGVGGIASAAYSVSGFAKKDLTQGLLWLGVGLFLIGLAVLLLPAALRLSKILLRVWRNLIHAWKKRLARKEGRR